MAHQHDAAVHHGTADDEYLGTPPGSGHEHTDASVGVIVKFGLWLLVSAIVVHIGMWLMFVLFVQQRTEEPVNQPFPIAVGQEPRLPAAPRLQQFPVNEHYEYRQQQQSALESYRWIDQNSGRVQIPVAEAMRLTIERGLPARAAAPDAEPVDPALIPADSSAGRTMERRR